MLKMTYLNENFDLARHALAYWRHDGETLPERLRWFRISSNAVYPFDRDGRLCFLRLSPAAEKCAGHLQAELDYLTWLGERGYPAMRPIPADDGRPLLTLDTPWGQWYASAFEGVPGHPLEKLPMTGALAASYGEALGHLHRLAMDYAAPGCRTHGEVLVWIGRTLEEQHAPQAAQDELREVTRLLRMLPQTRESYGLVHYDFEPDNVFWDGGSCHVIDFEDGMRHFYAVDLVQALDELPEQVHGAFLRGYRKACPQSDAKKADFPLMRRFRNLYTYARLLHCLSDTPQLQPEWMPQLIARLSSRRQELEQEICGQLRNPENNPNE